MHYTDSIGIVHMSFEKNMKLVDEKISLDELKIMSEKMFNSLVKAVVDIEKQVMVVDAEFHADQEHFLLENYQSKQKDLWGINLHPSKFPEEEWIEFDSMINCVLRGVIKLVVLIQKI